MGGVGTTVAWVRVAAPHPVQYLTVGVGERGVLSLSFAGGEGPTMAALTGFGYQTVEDPGRTSAVAAQLAAYLAGERTRFELELDWSLSSGLQRAVLQALYTNVGYGRTTTYGELARASGAFHGADGVIGARAVGQTMGGNPIPVIVACHRVLAADGLGGFARNTPGALDIKRWLLELEGALPPTLDF